ncbi:MAG TPA: GNAT family N-acetyltransferase, partial [Ignavibacteriaceae bacterium]|nr:GNAT family N-acetyltransferase [Ignavibacteriaceae bacterium]
KENKKTMNENISIRLAEEKDIPLILSLIKELAEFEKLLDKLTVTEEILKQNLFGKKKYAEVLIAEINKSAIGYAIFFHNFSTFSGKPGIYLEDLYVKPEFRNKGIGKKLLNRLIEIAKERDCGRVEWVVLDWNKKAIDFYKNLGAEEMSEWLVYRLTEDKF